MRELTEREQQVVLLLDKAPNLEKNIHFVAAHLGLSYNTVYHEVKILLVLGVLHKHVNPSGKVFYIPNKEILTEIKAKTGKK